jgi:hypothetical protein
MSDDALFNLSEFKATPSEEGEIAWQYSRDEALVDKSLFTKEVARCWNEASFSTKFTQFHPNWQRVLLAFARKIQKIEK